MLQACPLYEHSMLMGEIPNPFLLLQENDRLLELLAHMDGERSRLAADLQEHLAELVRLRACATDGAAGERDSGSAVAGRQQAERQRAAQLESELAAERRRREAAERDFQELLGSMEVLGNSPSPAPSISHGSAASAGSPAADDGQLERLQAENETLRRDLAATQARHSAAAAASSSLHSIAAGLHSISGGGGGSRGSAMGSAGPR